MSWKENVTEEYFIKKEEALLAGGKKKQDKELEKGKLLARERLQLLFDNKHFTEINMLIKSRVCGEESRKEKITGDGIIAGFGKVDGRTVYAVAQDCTVSGGSGGEMHVEKMCRTLEMAIKTRSPFVSLCDSGGARIEEGIASLSAYSRLFYLNTIASGYIPQISAIMGNCAGGSSYSPAMCDFIFMVEKTSQFFITGPKVIKAVTGENISMEELGGSKVHSRQSGVVNFVYKNDEKCICGIKKLLDYLCAPRKEYSSPKEAQLSEGNNLEDIVPHNSKYAYDVRNVISLLADDNSFFEVSESFAKNMVTGYARFDGRAVGIVANQPSVMGGALDCDGADKCARFVRTCDCFDIPILVLVDVPGFYPGALEEQKGILRHGSKMLYAFSEATVPKISLILRKAYGGAYCAMNSKSMGADMVFAWPICEIAVMGAEGAVDVIYHREIKDAESSKEFRKKKIREYSEKYLNPYYAASLGMVDEVILPQESREKLITAFDALETKTEVRLQKKHGNIPL